MMDKEASGFNTKQTVAIVGLGLIGGSYARGLRRIGTARIIAVDPDEKALNQAFQEGMVDEIYTAGSEALKKASLVIFCTAADVMIRFLADHRQFFAPGTILTDVAGIKGDTAAAIAPLVPDGVDFIPGHPMAGREGRGYKMASADIFNGANYILVPMAGNKEEDILAVKNMAMALGCSHVVRVSPKQHDELIAYTSSLPHVLATALVNSESMNTMTKYFVAGSFRDGTRVADINAPLWTKLFLSNKENLLKEIDRFDAALKSFAAMLAAEDTKGMTKFLQQAALRRRELVHETHSR
ncbi:prephenate dehydrogenase/arogenate dehydrogenase family protein [Megasphaera sp.]|uniref:prephenate dehydrogenase n=1 Tax=Megasphaera sp. TaxID=2023260 RepID=UPI0025E997AC|nr:prephenate dehydrogenase/arogenate dehydrogenase family protein [uncultured Megasphaera sp.]